MACNHFLRDNTTPENRSLKETQTSTKAERNNTELMQNSENEDVHHSVGMAKQRRFGARFHY
jgi:hypothetical protein